MNDADALTASLHAKRRKTLEAQLALKGYVLVNLADGTWLIQKWGLATSPLPRWDDVEAFAKQVGI